MEGVGGRIAPGRLTLFMMGELEEQSQMWQGESMITLIGIDKVRTKHHLRLGIP